VDQEAEHAWDRSIFWNREEVIAGCFLFSRISHQAMTLRRIPLTRLIFDEGASSCVLCMNIPHISNGSVLNVKMLSLEF
jgi:hypothetical protein